MISETCLNKELMPFMQAVALNTSLDMYVNNELGIMKLGKVKTKWPKQ